MVFSSLFFVFGFLPIALALYYLVPMRAKNLMLLAVSLVFYAWGEPVYVVLMVLSIAINYAAGREIGALVETGQKARAKTALLSTVVVDLGVLGFYKYAGFFVQNFNAISPVDIPDPDLALPIGISFYTFQVLSYIIDVYRGHVEAQRNIITFGAYVTMFPQLIAGPIVRYADIERQLMSRTLSWARMGDGTVWFLRGLAKKVLIADTMGAFHESILSLGTSGGPALTAWLGCFAYTMQIYFDFSGYSDMAIGLGKMLGFDFLRNFNYPYIATSITDFWRRWHMSLSGWFRDYVYIPLGGNRCSKGRHIFNLLVVWSLTGMWHGAAWNFIMWGAYFGILLIVEKYAFDGALTRLPKGLGHVYTMVVVMISWVLFSSSSGAETLSYLGMMFGLGGGGLCDATSFYFLRTMFFWGVIAAVFCTPAPLRWFNSIFAGKPQAQAVFQCVCYALLFAVCIAFMVSSTYSPFLYFRF
ncbi:MAG: MBOAT family O-acyltransferase [Eggerthellaceae bacterium]